MFTRALVISPRAAFVRYSRTQALRDGTLRDVTDVAKQAGFIWPVAMTRTAWSDCVQWTEADSQAQCPQHEADRLWDVLFLGARAVRCTHTDTDRLQYRLYRVPRDGHTQKPCLVLLAARADPGDFAEPVITTSMVNEAPH